MSNVSPIPEGYSSLCAYLIVPNAVEAIAFYEKAVGAEPVMRMPGFGGENSTMPAEIRIGNSMLMLSDENLDWQIKSAQTIGGSPVMMHLYVEDVDAVFQQAVDAGCEIASPVTEKQARYESKKNLISFKYGDSLFGSTGIGYVHIGKYGQSSEHFQFGANRLKLPKGWSYPEKVLRMPRQGYFHVLLQNAPPIGVLKDKKIPKTLVLSKFIDTRRVTLNFRWGINFPGGNVKGRAKVEAILEKLTLVKKKRVPKKKAVTG